MTSPDIQHYVDQHRTFENNGASQSPQWLKDRRGAAIRRFAEIGFPDVQQEAWRFTSVKPIVNNGYLLPAVTDSPGLDSLESHLLETDAVRVVVVDGAFSEKLSLVADLPDGVTVCSLGEAIETGVPVVAEHLGKHVHDDNAFAALGAAFLRDGAFVHLGDGVELSRPIELLFVSTADGKVEHPRSLVVAGKNSSARIVESYVAAGGSGYFRNCATEVVLGEGANLELCRVQRESPDAYHIATTASYQGRSSRLVSTYVVLGSRIMRHDINAVLDGEGAECEIRGFYMLGDDQHVDHHTLIDHASPHCQSKEYLNGVLDDNSRAVFTGRIVVREGAQKTDSKQSNNNLLLSENARVDSQPQLEIYADDVRCTHGATLGPLRDDAVLYLRSRGIAAADAKRMLTYGFGTEIIDQIGLDDTRERLEAIIRGRLGIEV